MDELSYLHSAIDQYSNVPTETLPKIFLVEDDPLFREGLIKYISKKTNLDVHAFSGPSEVIEFLGEKSDRSTPPFIFITDISLGDNSADGLFLIDFIKERRLDFVSIVMTGFASIESAITATKKGVYHYLTKPFEMDSLVQLILEVSEKKFSLSREDVLRTSGDGREVEIKKNYRSKKFKIEVPSAQDLFCGIIGRTKIMKTVFERVEKVARSNSTVLIHGPSGTGKELIAGAIHRLSSRSHESIISVNCGAIPSELLESELFGHEKGAFTGAINSRAGRFELANGGTIFLDEIGDMPLLLQVKLLRVLQNRTIERVGGNGTFNIDVRIITATHRDLEKSVNEGTFREDLFYRLNVIPIILPSLEKRREDIPLLMGHFLHKFVSADGRNQIEFTDEVMDVFMAYEWPGNVRELENLMERLVILRGGSTIKLSDLPSKFLKFSNKDCGHYEDLIGLPEEGIDLKMALLSIEDSLIRQALEKTKGNKNQASLLLKMNRTTLIEKLKRGRDSLALD